MVGGGKTRKKTISNLSPDTLYYIRIRVYYIIDGRSCCSPFTRTATKRTASPYYVYSGFITNAVDGCSISNATLYFRSGKAKKKGKVLKKCKTNAAGLYSVYLKKGTYTVEVRKKGYIKVYITIYVYMNMTSSNTTTISISKPVKSRKFRVVLTWGASPEDLDAHLTGPSNTYGGRFHVYFYNKNAYYNSNLAAMLDIDDRNGFGPETITTTMNVLKNGVYRYYVHDFTNKNRYTSNALGNSGARVVVYSGKNHVGTFNVPASDGTLWHVFDIRNGKVVNVNQMGYASSTSSIG